MRSLLSFFIFICICLGQWKALAGPLGTIKVGLEFEYAGQLKASRNSDPKTFMLLLEKIKNQFGGSKISVKPWNKYSNAQNTYYAYLTDRYGRRWQAVPEIMNTDKFDGYELITPPLDRPEDGELLKNALSEISATGQFVEGRSSSTHYTFDVSQLIDSNGNANRLVNLILFLESHLPEIYNAVGTKRYNRIINKYTVPLGVNQKALLRELSDLPQNERTYRRVRDVFFKYHRQELDLVSGNLIHAWKYRAINYGKLFGLGHFEGSELPVIEIRISDLVNEKNVLQVGELFTTIFEKGARAWGQKFDDPYPRGQDFKLESATHAIIDEKIRTLKSEKYEEFLYLLQLDPDQFPQHYQKARIFSCGKAHLSAS